MKTLYFALVVASIAASSAISYMAGRDAGRGEGRNENQPEIQRLAESLRLEEQQNAGLLEAIRIEKATFEEAHATRLEGIGKAREIAETLKSAAPDDRETLSENLLASLGTSFAAFPGDVELWSDYIRLSVGEQEHLRALAEARNLIRDHESRAEAARRTETEGLPSGMLRVKPVALSE